MAILGAWTFCAAQHGFLLGFGLGWRPAAIRAAVVTTLVRWLWPLLAIVAILLALTALKATVG